MQSDADFKFVCDIKPLTNENGKVIEYYPDTDCNGEGKRLNKYGKGPFCKFKIPTNISKAGVYIIKVNQRVKYVGECEDLSRRYNMGYGSIVPRNCYADGQSTNCKVNSYILDKIKRGSTVSLFFYETEDRFKVESKLIQKYAPEWNSYYGKSTDIKAKVHIEKTEAVIEEDKTEHKLSGVIDKKSVPCDGRTIREKYLRIMNENNFVKSNTQVKNAVWLGAALMTYCRYMRLKEAKSEVTRESFWLIQKNIVNISQELTDCRVQPARVSQWYNGDHKENIYNYLRGNGSMRRLTAVHEFNGIREVPEDMNINENIKCTFEGTEIDIKVSELIKWAKAIYSPIITGSKDNMSKETYECKKYESEIYFKLKEAELEAKSTDKRLTHDDVMSDLREKLGVKI